jgi:hypothetical protein
MNARVSRSYGAHIASILVLVACTASPGLASGDPRVNCSIYKAKVQQWKTDNLRMLKENGIINPRRESKNMIDIKKAMMSVMVNLGYTQTQVVEMRGWDIDGARSQEYFWLNGSRIPRQASPYQMEIERGLMGKEPQAVAFCEGLGIQVRAK